VQVDGVWQLAWVQPDTFHRSCEPYDPGFYARGFFADPSQGQYIQQSKTHNNAVEYPTLFLGLDRFDDIEPWSKLGIIIHYEGMIIQWLIGIYSTHFKDPYYGWDDHGHYRDF
jgi:hypothetical protein